MEMGYFRSRTKSTYPVLSQGCVKSTVLHGVDWGSASQILMYTWITWESLKWRFRFSLGCELGVENHLNSFHQTHCANWKLWIKNNKHHKCLSKLYVCQRTEINAEKVQLYAISVKFLGVHGKIALLNNETNFPPNLVKKKQLGGSFWIWEAIYSTSSSFF